MALQTIKPVTRKYITCHMADSSTASSAFCASPGKGQIMKVSTTIFNAITSLDTNMTLKVNGVVTGFAWKITNVGSAAGSVYSATSATTRALAHVNDGDTIEFVSGGEGSTAAATTCMVEIEMD